ncbi:MAG TPA: DUF5683 domain-containing protein [Bacteroidales bacterium]|nr:DUF5683 domain-containing protein [Bacteroidales bacterium]HNS45835.1 DUF5683 domain-containing protein [Bacteroidales bacterium]
MKAYPNNHPVTSSRSSQTVCRLQIIFLLVLSFCLSSSLSLAQDTLTAPLPGKETPLQKTHSPKKASIYSAVLPGLGQAYNHKYWKIPIIYAGFGAFAYFLHTNFNEYEKFHEAYLWKVKGDTIPIDNEYIYKYETADQLKNGTDYYRRNFELTCILTGVWYLLNILDATVDAHLMDYDINEDLSVHVQPGLARPTTAPRQPIAGITMTLRFK